MVSAIWTFSRVRLVMFDDVVGNDYDVLAVPGTGPPEAVIVLQFSRETVYVVAARHSARPIQIATARQFPGHIKLIVDLRILLRVAVR